MRYRSHTKTSNGFSFAELGEQAKEHARDQFRNTDDNWWDYLFDDFVACAGLLGIEITARPITLMNGKISTEPDIYFELHRQGAGASFSGNYEPPEKLMGIVDHAPQDTGLRHLAERLTALQVRVKLEENKKLHAKILHHGRVENMVDVTVFYEFQDDSEPSDHDQRELTDIIEHFAHWMYKQLDDESNYRYSDEYVDECLEDLTFDEEGALI